MNWRWWIFPALLLLILFSVIWSPDALWRLHSLEYQPTQAQNETELLRAENAYLKAQLSDKQGQLPPTDLPFATISADIYSRYPLNFKHELIINKGTKDGLKNGAAVFAIIPGPEGRSSSTEVFLLGRVSSTSETKSTIQTIFSHDFKNAVRISSKKVPSLLTGGLSPILSTIPRGAHLSPGDVVISADPSLPYGLILGRTENIRPSSDQLFKEADLELPYDINDLIKVAVRVE